MGPFWYPVSRAHNMSGLDSIDCKSTQANLWIETNSQTFLDQANNKILFFPTTLHTARQCMNLASLSLFPVKKSQAHDSHISTIPPYCLIPRPCLMLACRLPPADWTQDRACWLAGPTHTTHPRNPEAEPESAEMTPHSSDTWQSGLYSGKCQEAGSEKRRIILIHILAGLHKARAEACPCPAKQIIGLWSKLQQKFLRTPRQTFALLYLLKRNFHDTAWGFIFTRMQLEIILCWDLTFARNFKHFVSKKILRSSN